MRQIGIIGAGIMASGMARNFLKHGYTVSVWNRTRDKLKPLSDAGAKVCSSPKEVAEVSDIIIECVSDDDASRSVWLGDTSILAGATPDKVLITSATLTLRWVEELSETCRERGFKFLDMPLTGSRPGAEGGTLKLLVGGDTSVLDDIRPDLLAIADKIYYFGSSGMGMRFKLVLNILIAIHANAAAQAIVLAEKAGLDIKQVHEVLFDAPMGPASPTTNLVFNLLDQPDHLNWAIKWVAKDLDYAKTMAEQYAVPMDLLDATRQDFTRAKESGLADRDLTQIVRLYEEGASA